MPIVSETTRGIEIDSTFFEVSNLSGHALLQWIFWVGPFIGAAIAAAYHQYVLRASATKLGSSASFNRG
jgi:hypothetical protein